MSDTEDQSHLATIAAAIAESEPDQSEQEIEQPEQPQIQPEPTSAPVEAVDSALSDHAQNFLSHVPDEDRAVVAKYLQPWDAGAQRRFRQYQDELAQFQELGDPDILQRATFLYRELMDNPQRFRTLLDQVVSEQNGQPVQTQQPRQQFQQPQYSVDDLDPDVVQPMQAVLQAWGNQFGQRFQTYDQQLASMQSMLQRVNDYFQENEQTTAQQREEQKLAEELDLLKKQYGEFDDGYVLSQIAAGFDPDEAVQNFQRLKESLIGSVAPRKAPPGPTLSGSGSPPAQPTDYSQLSDRQVRELVTQALQQSNQD